jgi:hypothetical protein
MRPRSKPAVKSDPSQELRDQWPRNSWERSKILLQALHILTVDGRLNQDSRRKLKQVLHLQQAIRPALERVWTEAEAPVLADLGAGKSYLGLILYDLFIGPSGKGKLIAIEQRADLAAAAERIARDADFKRVEILAKPIAQAQIDSPVSAVTALHACDTATDEAIAFALKHEARLIVMVPCCQAEASRQLEGEGAHELAQLWRHPIQRREFGAHVTNVIRALFLESQGYKVRVTELTGWEHSLKNELIIAERHQRGNAQAEGQLRALLKHVPVRPKCLPDALRVN